MPRPRERTERGHFKSRVLEKNRQAQLSNGLGAPAQLGIFVRTKEPRDPHKKARVRPLVHFPLELKLPGAVTLPPIPQEGRGRPSALTEARARLILAVTCTGATVEVIAAVGGVTPSTLRSWLTRDDHDAYRIFQRAFAAAETYATLAALKASAFLVAGRSVTLCLQWEVAHTPELAERYKAVIENLPAIERKWLAFFNEARTVVIHRQGKAPLAEQRTGLLLLEMPKIPADLPESAGPFPSPTRRYEEFVLFFFHNTRLEVLEGCWAFLNLLIKVVREFIPGYVLPADPPFVFEVRPMRRTDVDGERAST